MAVINLSITVPDADVSRLRAATRDAFGAALTDAEIIEVLRQKNITDLKRLVYNYEKKSAVLAAENALYNTDIT